MKNITESDPTTLKDKELRLLIPATELGLPSSLWLTDSVKHCR